jgi:hypothetical protein
MGQGPEIKPGKAAGPVITEERATMPRLYPSGPGTEPMTQEKFLAAANRQVGHVTITAEISSKA